MNWIDTLMLGYFSTAKAVGIYNAAMPTARLLRAFPSSFRAIFMPVASELYSRNALSDLKRSYSAVTKWILSLVLPAFLLMPLFSNWILKILFGSEFIAGAMALSILAFGYLIICIVGPTGQILQAYGRTEILMGCNLFGAGLNFGLYYLLIPVYGVVGAALATGSSLAFMNLLHLLFVHRIAGVQPFRLSYFKPLLASLVSVLVVYAVTKVVGVSLVSLFSLIGTFFVFPTLYFFLLLLIKSFEQEDLMVMRAIDQRLGTKSYWIRRIVVKFL